MLEYSKDMYRVYLNWLFEKIGSEYYENLLYELWRIPYKPELELDKNWAVRGLKLREEFVNTTKGAFNCPGYGRKAKDKRGCSVLEMMIAISIAAAGSVGEGTKWATSRDWFHCMIENLGLDKATNSNFDIYKSFLWREMENITSHKIDRLGSPYNWFVLEKSDLTKMADPEAVDFQKMDIWRQLLCWTRAHSDLENIFERENVVLETADLTENGGKINE